MPTNDDAVLKDDFSRYDDMLPDNCAPIHGWRIIYFVDDEGNERWRWGVDGDPVMSSTIGVFSMVVFDLLHNGSELGHGDDLYEDE